MATPPNATVEELSKEVENLKELLKKKEYERARAVDTLKRETRLNCHIVESDIVEWPFLSICDKKVLAVLHWNKLSKSQQDEFDDISFKEIEEASQKFREDVMTDPIKMKNFFLKHSYPILNQMLDMATTSGTKLNGDSFAFREVWEVLKGILNSTKNKAPPLDLRNKDISGQIDEILSSVTAGDITFDEAKEYISIVSSGFNLQELPKLMAKLELIENK